MLYYGFTPYVVCRHIRAQTHVSAVTRSRTIATDSKSQVQLQVQAPSSKQQHATDQSKYMLSDNDTLGLGGWGCAGAPVNCPSRKDNVRVGLPLPTVANIFR